MLNIFREHLEKGAFLFAFVRKIFILNYKIYRIRNQDSNELLDETGEELPPPVRGVQDID